jgi:hypothetical protein
MRSPGWHRPLALAAAALVGISGCTSYRWKVVPLKELDVAEQRLLARRVRLQMARGVVLLDVERVVHPYVEGRAEPNSGPVQVDLRRTRKLELLPAATESDQGTRTIAVKAEALAAQPLAGRLVRLHTDRGSVRLIVDDATWPWVRGSVKDGKGSVLVDLRQVTDLQVREANVAASVGMSVLAVGGVLAVVALLVALTKESCPIVYVDRGQGLELVGEAYAGAAFRSIQRDDLLPLAALDDQRALRVRLRNEARETQFTDRAELVVVDHDEATRVLSTVDGHLVAASAATAPARASNLRGHDVLALLAGEDGRPWQADLVRAAREPGVPLREGVEVQFDDAPASAVLEMLGGNTDWLDLAFGRFFAAMDDRLPRYLAVGNDPASGARIRRWREREGVDLAVDVWREGAWRRVTVVPTVGPVAMRRIAIPLSAAAGRLRVRLSGGLGFWRLDQVALSPELPSRHAVRVLPPRVARGPGGVDQREAVRAADGVYDALAELGDSLDLDFDLPPRPPGTRRFAFLSTNGYYNVHPPLQRQWLPGTLRAVRDRPGSLARLALDLARAYAEPVAPAAAP